MSTNDDSSTILSVHGSDGSVHDDHQAEKYRSLYAQSPYTDPIISLAIDTLSTPYTYLIHASVLAKSPPLEAKCLAASDSSISLPELDAATAHTLIAFLYTGRYETLEYLGPEDAASVTAFKLGACVYCAASRYGLPTLAALAQDEVVRHGPDVDILQKLSVAREHAFPLLPEADTWFPSYVEDAIKRAVKVDPGLCVSEGFAAQIEGDKRFRQAVMRAVVGTYAVAAGGIGGGDDPPMDAQKEANDAVEDTPIHKERADSAVEDDKGDSVQLDDIEPLVPESPVHRPASPPAPESVTDELDLKARTFQSSLAMKPKNDDVAGQRSIGVKWTPQPSHDTPKLELKWPEQKEAMDPAVEVVSPSAEVVDEVPSLSKKDKKKKRKGKKSDVPF